MGELLRSVPMQLAQLFVQVEAAHDTVDELAQLGLIQFVDLNPETNAFQRNFVNEVRRADEMERKLRYFEEQVKKAAIDDRNLPTSLLVDEQEAGSRGTALMDELEARFEEIEQELLQLNSNQATLDRNHNELIELRYVLETDDSFFGHNAPAGAREDDSLLSNDRNARQSAPPQAAMSYLGFVTGVLARDKMFSFERVLWRATRGNLIFKQCEIAESIKDPSSESYVDKNVFIIFYQGGRSAEKIRKLCESFGANLYPCPEDGMEREKMKEQIKARIADLHVVLDRTNDHSTRVLRRVASQLEGWKQTVLKEKAIYHTMNLFNYDVGRKCLIAEGWCPQESTEEIQLALRRATDRAGAGVPSILSIISTKETPPTHFKTNVLTQSYQDMTDSYGIPRYREINPTPFNIIMFPFLFAVMFGDLGHGFLLFLIAASFLIFESRLLKTQLNEMIVMVFQGRYLLIMMACFAMYTGFLYNECFGVPIDVFGTGWYYNKANLTSSNVEQVYAECTKATVLTHYSYLHLPIGASEPVVAYGNTTYCSYVYPWGVDPLWMGAVNELDYTDSLKMKMSVIFGVVQMMFGVILNILNYVHFGEYMSIILIGVPQVLFLTLTFGYMDFLIIYKWLVNWNLSNFRQVIPDYQVPLLLNVMIQMFLSPWSVPDDYKVYNGQVWVQLSFVLIAVITAPWMLLGKPLYDKWLHGKKAASYTVIHDHSSDAGSDDANEEEEGEEYDFGEEMVHSIIHTIEYILGCVSNTASYLRLWALSLAHSELSNVFKEGFFVTLDKNFSVQFFLIWGGWSAWAALTVGVLLVMEALSAFLHALRLHWVEFQNKFYKGDGTKFMPLSYQKLIAGDEEALAALTGQSPIG